MTNSSPRNLIWETAKRGEEGGDGVRKEWEREVGGRRTIGSK
jgi:hypothetical protein